MLYPESALTSVYTDDGAKPRTMMDKTSRDSDGNLVNVGNFDDTGANVNNDNPDNRNDNMGVSFSRSVPRHF